MRFVSIRLVQSGNEMSGCLAAGIVPLFADYRNNSFFCSCAPETAKRTRASPGCFRHVSAGAIFRCRIDASLTLLPIFVLMHTTIQAVQQRNPGKKRGCNGRMFRPVPDFYRDTGS